MTDPGHRSSLKGREKQRGEETDRKTVGKRERVVKLESGKGWCVRLVIHCPE